MTIAYNLGIPNSPDNPSTDQPNMKTNNDNIATYVAIDHVAFNTSGSGQHAQVTFNANNVPSVPTAPPILFTNTVAALPQLFFYSGDAAHSSTQYVANANGSTFLLGGIILKWGHVTATDNTTIGFPVQFPNNCFNVQITVDAITVLPTLVTVSGTPNATAFTPRVKDTNGATASPVSIFYLAIGN
jgi:hypothetical protein